MIKKLTHRVVLTADLKKISFDALSQKFDWRIFGEKEAEIKSQIRSYRESFGESNLLILGMVPVSEVRNKKDGSFRFPPSDALNYDFANFVELILYAMTVCPKFHVTNLFFHFSHLFFHINVASVADHVLSGYPNSFPLFVKSRMHYVGTKCSAFEVITDSQIAIKQYPNLMILVKDVADPHTRRDEARKTRNPIYHFSQPKVMQGTFS